MKISQAIISKRENQIIYTVKVSTPDCERSLWYSIDQKFENFLDTSDDAALIALLIPAMAVGEDLYIEGAISERLFFLLSQNYQILLQNVIPSLHQIKIHPEELIYRNCHSSGVAAGFSCGIDSFSMLYDYYLKKKSLPATG